MKIMTVVGEEAPANFVPAAAVIRSGLALFGITGRKAGVARQVSGESPELNSGTAIETVELESQRG